MLRSFVLFAVACFGVVQRAAAEPCAIAPDVPAIHAIAVYADKAGSQKSADAQRIQADLLRPLRRSLEMPVNELEEGRAACAASILRYWASKSAFEPGDYARPEMRQLIRVATSLNLFTVKLSLAGQPVWPSLESWLGELTEAVAAYYPAEPVRGKGVANLQVWSGVAAASFLLWSNSPRLLAYQNRMWDEAIAAIGEGGYVPRELERKQRALLYHQYYYSALEMLFELRKVLGLPVGNEALAAIQRLERLVIQGVCDPSSFVANAPVPLPKQLRNDENAAVIMHVLGSRDQRLALEACGQKIQRKEDVFFAGDLGSLNSVLETVRLEPLSRRP